MKKPNLKPREAEAYQLLLNGYKKNKYCPPQSDLVLTMNVTKAYVSSLVKSLVNKGYLIKTELRGVVIPRYLK